MYDSSTGDIRIDNNKIEDYNVVNLRSQIGYVPQDVFLFSDSIYNNIGFGADAAAEETILQAAKDADVYNNIIDFPDGFANMLG